MRRAAKVDDNQPLIVLTFRKLGWSVECLHAVGGGVPDLLIGKMGFNFLVEVKDGKKPPSKRKLNADQVEWHEKWRGQACVIETVEQAMAFHAEKTREIIAMRTGLK